MRERKRTNRHPVFDGKPRGVWVPEAVGVVQGYPKTQETWQLQSDRLRAVVVGYNKAVRDRLPSGWGGRRKEFLAERAKAPARAERIYKKMVKAGQIVMDPGTDPERAELALKGFIEIAHDSTQSARDRLAAFKALAEFTKAKPTTKQEVTVNTAESFLDGLIPKM